MKRWVGVVLPVTAIVMSFNILAQSGRSFLPQSMNSWFVGVGAGFERLFFQDRTDFLSTAPLAPTFPDQFTLANTRTTNGMLSAFVGYQWRPVTNGRINLFTEYDSFTSFSPDGTRLAFSLPGAATQYSYSLAHQALLFGAKVDVAQWHHLMPYVEAALGVSRNKFSDFSNDSQTDPTGTTAPINPFPNQVNYDLAYVVGLGVDVLMQHNWLISFGYRFGQWGDVDSGNVSSVPAPPVGPGGPLLAPIHLSNALYSNQALVRMSYSFSG